MEHVKIESYFKQLYFYRGTKRKTRDKMIFFMDKLSLYIKGIT